MEFEGLKPEQEPQEPVAPEPQPIDPQAAMEIAAQQLGVDPNFLADSVRLQEENRRVYEENRRRQREFDLREAKLQALEDQRVRYTPEPNYDGMDPHVKQLFDEVRSTKQMLVEERQQRKREIESQAEATRIGRELETEYLAVMRTVPTQSQIDQERFFKGGMSELWPEGPPPGMSPKDAVLKTARYLGLNVNQSASFSAPTGTANYRNPRMSIVIPGGSAASSQAGMPNVDTAPQRQGETIEQYGRRIEEAGRRMQQQIQESGIRSLPDRYSSG